jgi:hypothetical protein
MSEITDAKAVLAEERTKRDADPEYSLEKSKQEYEELVDDLHDFVNDYDQKDQVKFTQTLERKVHTLASKLRDVQEDIDRVGELENPGWTSSRRVFPQIRGNRLAYNGSPFVDGDVKYDDEDLPD